MTRGTVRAPRPGLPRASTSDTLRIAGTVIVPLLARGVIVRRPGVVAVAEHVDADRRAVRLLQRMRERYGRGPLRLRIPGRHMVVLLSPEHVHRVLTESPEPFTPATREKRAALAHFEPHGVLISGTEERRDRRRFNEEVLDSPHAVHRDADLMVARIHEEVDALLADVAGTGTLTWEQYATAWWRMVRRVTLGDGAADDDALTDDLRKLRATANWAFLHPRRRALRRRFFARLRPYLERAEPGSLAASAARAPVTAVTEPEQQVPQWLFAFDAAAWAGYRALALLATHPHELATARREIDAVDVRTPQDLPYLRACVLESLRLWPTTPALLRESTRRTSWEDGPMPAHTSILTFAPFFHRDDQRLAQAHRFAPELWDGPRTEQDWPLVPFSAGPAACPGRNLVLHTTSTVLARLVGEHEITLQDADRLDAAADLPGTLDLFSLRFAVTPRRPSAARPS